MKAKPIFEFLDFTQHQKHQLYTWRFEDELSLVDMRKTINEKFGVDVSRPKIDRQCQRLQFCEAFDITETDLLAMLNGEPITLNNDGFQIVRQKALLMTMKDDLSPAQLKMLQSIFDYDFRKEVIQTRLQLAKNRDARAQNSSARTDKLADHKIELDHARLALARDRFQFQQSNHGRRRREESHSSSESPISGENCTPDSPTSDFELRVADYLKKYPQYTREEIVEYLSLTADQRRDRFFGGFGICGDELTLHKARIDRELCESREADPEEEMKLVFERELPTLEEARRLETEARAALELEPLDYPVDEDLRAKLGLPIKNYHDDDCLCNKCASIKGRRRGDESQISSESTRTPAPLNDRNSLLSSSPIAHSPSPIREASCTPVPSPHTPDRNPNLNPPNPSENSVSSVSSVLNPPPLSPLELAVSEYTRLRTKEYQTKTVHLSRFRTKLEYCPCGAQLPCPDHAPKEKPFRKLFWHINPEDPDFAAELKAHGLPWRDPNHDPVAEKKAAELKARVAEYTQLRHEEFRARGTAIFNYQTRYQFCPCGRELPCPRHAPEHNPFPKWFWETSALSSDYILLLEARGLPYTSPRDNYPQSSRQAAKP